MSSTPSLILISGWAHSAADLEELRKRLETGQSVDGQLFPVPIGRTKPPAEPFLYRTARSSLRSSKLCFGGVGQGRLAPPTLSTADLWSEYMETGRPRPGQTNAPAAHGLGSGRLQPNPRYCPEIEPPSIYAENLKAMIERNGGKTFLAGWSLGGMIALETAINWPDLVAGLILISSTPKFCRDKNWPAGAPASALRAMLGGLKRNPGGVFEAFFRNVTTFSRNADSAVETRTESACAMDLRELAYGLEYLRDRDFREAAKKLVVPALILHGGRDSVVNAEAAHKMNRLLANSRLRVYDAAGHDLPSQDPQQVADDMMNFMEKR